MSKFRALRLAWARVEEACGLEPRKADVQAESAWRMMTARDPYVNIMRGAIAAFSAGLGGADSVCVLPHTLAVGLPDGLARRLARNGQLILLRESNLGFVADPAAGAGGFEALTQASGRQGWNLFQTIERQGGLPAALAFGAFQREVVESAAVLARDGGSNEGADHRRQRPSGSERTARRDRPGRARSAKRLRRPRARSSRCDWRNRSRHCATARTPNLRETGSRPKAYLVALGPETKHRGRAAFMREWFEGGGIETFYDGEAATPEKAVERLRASGASIACLCGDGEAYGASAEAFAEAVKGAGVKGLCLAGRPGDQEAALRRAGVDDFIFSGGDAIAAFGDLYRRIGA